MNRMPQQRPTTVDNKQGPRESERQTPYACPKSVSRFYAFRTCQLQMALCGASHCKCQHPEKSKNYLTEVIEQSGISPQEFSHRPLNPQQKNQKKNGQSGAYLPAGFERVSGHGAKTVVVKNRLGKYHMYIPSINFDQSRFDNDV